MNLGKKENVIHKVLFHFAFWTFLPLDAIMSVPIDYYYFFFQNHPKVKITKNVVNKIYELVLIRVIGIFKKCKCVCAGLEKPFEFVSSLLAPPPPRIHLCLMIIGANHTLHAKMNKDPPSSNLSKSGCKWGSGAGLGSSPRKLLFVRWDFLYSGVSWGWAAGDGQYLHSFRFIDYNLTCRACTSEQM